MISVSLYPKNLLIFCQLFKIFKNQIKILSSIVLLVKNHSQNPFDLIARTQLIDPVNDAFFHSMGLPLDPQE